MTHNSSYALNAYRSAATQVAPEIAVVRLYDEVLRGIGRALKDTEERRIEDAYINITKVCVILRGLCGNLRFDVAPDMAETLKTTYVTNMIALHTAFGKPDAPSCYLRVMDGLLELRNSWAEVAGVEKRLSMPVVTNSRENSARQSKLYQRLPG